ncbi:class I SAM-dependent methyltransferase [Streptomyces sp. NPDC048290]|uniref:class I SAM-dependent methyltransferase n=1 Tax=Streptomyces sp. NPDC048290 TaxID=3155811 RepID=UPI003411FEF7
MEPVMDDHRLAELISLSDRPPGEADAALTELGPARVAEALLREIAARTRLLPGPAEKTTVQFDLGWADQRLRYLLTLGPDTHEVAPGHDPLAPATYQQDLPELLRAVFSPGRHDATRALLVRDSDEPHGLSLDDPWLRQRRLAVLAAHQATQAIEGRFTDLTSLAVRFDADKWGGHWYTPHYQRYFEPLRDRRVKVLEIGVGGYDAPDLGGASLRMWKHYFYRGQVYGLDLYPKHGVDEPRLRTFQGDQGDPAFLTGFAAEHGPFDIVVDDGSHFSEHVLTSFAALFPSLRPGGLYVVEDTQSSYWPGWGGSTDLNASSTSMGFVKTLLDGLNHQEQIRPADRPASTTERTVTGVHVHHNLVVIEKGVNTEQGTPSWVPRTEDPRTWYPAQ